MAKRKQTSDNEYHQLTKNERAAYEDSLKYYRDLKNSFDTAEQDGFEKAEKLYETKLKKLKNGKRKPFRKLLIVQKSF